MNWEYAVIPLKRNKESDQIKTLNLFGQNGWELVSVDDGLAYFKRALVAK